MNSKRFLFILMAIFVTSLTSCLWSKSESSSQPAVPPTLAPNDERQADGTSDPGGGGNIALSTEGQVIRAILNTRLFLMSDKGRRLLETHLFRIVSVYDPRVAPEGVEQVRQVFQKIVSPKEWALRSNLANPPPYSLIKDYLPASHMFFYTHDTPDANCSPKKGYDPYPDAYVSKFDYGASVCFNIQRLRRLTPSNLQIELIGLWVHELAHLNGFDEATARTAASFVQQYLPLLATAQAAQPTLRGMFQTVTMAYTELAQLRDELPVTMDQLTPENMAHVTRISSYLATLKNYNNFIVTLDSIYAFNARVPTLAVTAERHRILIINASADAEALRQNLEKKLITGSSKLIVDALDHNLACVVKSLKKIADDTLSRVGVNPPYAEYKWSVVQDLPGLHCDLYDNGR